MVLFGLKNAVANNKRYAFGGGGAGSPYVISQLSGLYSGVPSFLDNQHTIETKDDAEAYLARLDQFALRLDEEAEVARHDVALGVVPPDFSIVKTLAQMRDLRSQPGRQRVDDDVGGAADQGEEHCRRLGRARGGRS